MIELYYDILILLFSALLCEIQTRWQVTHRHIASLLVGGLIIALMGSAFCSALSIGINKLGLAPGRFAESIRVAIVGVFYSGGLLIGVIAIVALRRRAYFQGNWQQLICINDKCKRLVRDLSIHECAQCKAALPLITAYIGVHEDTVYPNAAASERALQDALVNQRNGDQLAVLMRRPRGKKSKSYYWYPIVLVLGITMFLFVAMWHTFLFGEWDVASRDRDEEMLNSIGYVNPTATQGSTSKRATTP